MRNLLIIVIFLFSCINFHLIAQSPEANNLIYKGNKKATQENYSEAERSYRKAVSVSPESPEAVYNLGNAHYRNEDFDEATQRYFQTQKVADSKEERHKAFHNLGNSYMQKKDYEKAVEAYENALRNNPTDDETRYNYALAKSLLKNDPPQQDQDQDENQDSQDNQDNQDQQQDQQNQDQNEDSQDDQDNQDNQDQNQDQQNSDQNKDKGQPDEQENDQQNQDQNQQPERKDSQSELSPQQVTNLLEAMNNQEKQVQEKINAKKVKGQPVRGRKDW